jgi:hypothetical protein
MSEPLRYNATKVVGEYGEQARLQHRLHLSPDANGKWVKWSDYDLMNKELNYYKMRNKEMKTENQRLRDAIEEQENERA